MLFVPSFIGLCSGLVHNRYSIANIFLQIQHIGVELAYFVVAFGYGGVSFNQGDRDVVDLPACPFTLCERFCAD